MDKLGNPVLRLACGPGLGLSYMWLVNEIPVEFDFLCRAGPATRTRQSPTS